MQEKCIVIITVFAVMDPTSIMSAVTGATAGAKPDKEVSSRTPYIELCKTIKSKTSEIQDALSKKLKSAQFNQSDFFNEQYKSIAGEMTDEIVQNINGMFNDTNIRIAVLLSAKKIYQKEYSQKGDIFVQTNVTNYYKLLQDQIDETVGIVRENETAMTGGAGNPLAGLMGKSGELMKNIQGKSGDMLKSGLSGLAQNDDKSSETSCPTVPEKKLYDAFDKVFGDAEFQDAIGKIILKRIEQIILEKKVIDTVLSEQINKVADTYKAQFAKLAEVLSGYKLSCLLVIQTLSKDLLENYKETAGTTIGDYLETLVLSKEAIAQRGGRRRTKHRRTNRRTHKRPNKNKNIK